MKTEQTQDKQRSEGLADATGSALVDFHGRPLRPVNRKRPLRSGEFVANRHGQFLWEIIGCSYEGVRLQEQIHGGVSDYPWERFYAGFYERTDEPNAERSNPEDKS